MLLLERLTWPGVTSLRDSDVWQRGRGGCEEILQPPEDQIVLRLSRVLCENLINSLKSSDPTGLMGKTITVFD